MTTHQKKVVDSAFFTHCSRCRAVLPNVEEYKKIDGKPVCDKCFNEHQKLEKKPQCKNLITKEDRPFCLWLQSFLAKPEQCSKKCEGWKEASESD